MLTQRARLYLNGIRRDKEWSADPEKVAAYFVKQKLQLSSELLKVQLLYSGYELILHGHPGRTFLLNFISKQAVSSNAEIGFYPVDNGYLLEFGEHATAQFTFYITDCGEVCTWEPEVGDEPNIVCSSVEKYIEQYALKNELSSQDEHPNYYQVLNLNELNAVLHQEFIEIPECTDAYSYWCFNDFLTVAKGTWLHEPTFYFHVYGKSKSACASFVERLKSASIIG